MIVEQSFRVFLRKMYSEQLFLVLVTSLVRKPFEFVNFIHIHEQLELFNMLDVNLKNVLFTCSRKSVFLYSVISYGCLLKDD